MKNFKNLTVLVLFTAFISCNKNVEKPKVSYNKTSKTVVKQVDTTKILVADLPIQFDGTKYLIFPIGNLNISDNGVSKYESSSKMNEQSFTISNNMDNEITGYLQNLKFQKIDSDSITTLTDKPILLESTTYLKDFANKSKQQILVHLLADNDSNDDVKLDTNDIKSLYLSDISGAKFTKISVDMQEIINWKIIEYQNRLYFKTIEDTNKNGQFDKADKLHYSFVNLLEKDWKAVEYNPITN
jgi:hypothetical protein